MPPVARGKLASRQFTKHLDGECENMALLMNDFELWEPRPARYPKRFALAEDSPEKYPAHTALWTVMQI